MLQIVQQVFVGVIIAVVSGVIILLIEYHTGWFVDRLNRPKLHDLVVASVDWCKPILRKVGRFTRFMIGLLALIVLVWANAALLANLPTLSPYMGSESR